MSLSFERIQDDPRANQVTPFFRFETIEDIEASNREKKPVLRTIELCEIRIAGDKNYAPAVPADSIWKTIDGRAITYAERFSEQYRQFVSGAAQEASGTPLEQLAPYGISQAQISLCRALRIHSIEAVHSLEGPNLKSLGVQGNELKRMADAYLADRASGSMAVSEIDDLKRQIAELTAKNMALSASDAVIEEAAFEDGVFSNMSDAQLKEYIRQRTGAAPRGNPSRDTLLRMAEEA